MTYLLISLAGLAFTLFMIHGCNKIDRADKIEELKTAARAGDEDSWLTLAKMGEVKVKHLAPHLKRRLAETD